jgi:hypothetical protein
MMTRRREELAAAKAVATRVAERAARLAEAKRRAKRAEANGDFLTRHERGHDLGRRAFKMQRLFRMRFVQVCIHDERHVESGRDVILRSVRM